MSRTRRWLLAPLLAALTSPGCSRRSVAAPPDIHYGLETCADCGMIISDPHYAAAIEWRAAPTGPDSTAVFDDIGCLLDWRRQHPQARLVAAWVKDVRTTAWLNAPFACYLHNRRLGTPMGWGVVAGQQATSFLELPIHGPVLTWPQILASMKAPSDGVHAPDSGSGAPVLGPPRA
ncbi:MAG: hypothetical protein ACREFX_11180 [Opitutaceae bacterium]